MENSIKIDDLGVPLFLETPIFWSEVGKEQWVVRSQAAKLDASASIGLSMLWR